jgi:hypothetical protein
LQNTTNAHSNYCPACFDGIYDRMVLVGLPDIPRPLAGWGNKVEPSGVRAWRTWLWRSDDGGWVLPTSSIGYHFTFAIVGALIGAIGGSGER